MSLDSLGSSARVQRSPAAWSVRTPSWKKYWLVLATRAQEDMVYRANYLLGALFRFLPLVTTVYLWDAVFRSLSEQGKEPSIAGYGYGDTVAYYLLVYVARGFSSMPGMSRDICNDIRDGALNRYLVRPVSYFGYQLAYYLAHKLVFWAVALVAFPPVFWLLRDHFSGVPDAAGWAAFLYSLLLAFAIGILFSFLVGLLAFWFLEISTFLYVILTVEYFLSGHLIPLTFLPEALQGWILYLPFAYEVYWPVALFLSRVPEGEAGFMLAVGTAWVAVLFAACRWVWARGIRRYGAVGG